MTSNKLLEQIVEYYVRQYNAVVTFNSNSAKTIVIGEMTIRLQQVFDDVVVIHYRSLQRTVNSVDDLKNNPFSFLSEKDDRINGTIRSYQLMQTITSLTDWLPDSDHQHHPPMYTFICNAVNHCIIINNDGTIKVDGQLVHSVDHYVSMKAQLENPQ